MATLNAYFIQCITNMHVGSGDDSYGIIDKLVQRDPVTHYPTIHASSLKGALRQHFEDNKFADVEAVFGKETNDADSAQSGKCNFLSADLVALPIRCTHQQYALSFCDKLVKATNTKAALLGSKPIFNSGFTTNTLYSKCHSTDTVYAEDTPLVWANHQHPMTVSNPIGDANFAFIKDAAFDGYCENLPVLARNKLGNDKNLWYEQIVPHQTIFLTYIFSNYTNYSEFEEQLLAGIVQIGANSSIGYGLCKFHKINL